MKETQKKDEKKISCPARSITFSSWWSNRSFVMSILLVCKHKKKNLEYKTHTHIYYIDIFKILSKAPWCQSKKKINTYIYMFVYTGRFGC